MLEATAAIARERPMGSPKTPILPGQARGLVYEVGNRRLIDGIDLTISGPSLTVFMGPNGAGKSLLLRLLHGLLQPSAGSVSWGGEAISEPIRKRQAMVFQRPVLLRRSVAANLRFVLQLRGRAERERIRELLRYVGLEAQARQPARMLSGGEQQRLAVARALVLEPQVLFLDEPTASLDPASTAAIEGVVKSAHERGTKVIFVTHDLGQAHRLADEVVFLHRGQILEQTPAAQFFDNPSSPEARNYLAGRLIL